MTKVVEAISCLWGRMGKCINSTDDSSPVEKHMPEGSAMSLGVRSDSCQSAHVVMHLVWQHNIAEVLFDFVTGLCGLSSSLPKPAARGVTNQLGRAQPSAQAPPSIDTLLKPMHCSKHAQLCFYCSGNPAKREHAVHPHSLLSSVQPAEFKTYLC